jgi:transposase
MLNPAELFVLRKQNTKLQIQNTKLQKSLTLRADKLTKLEEENKKLREELKKAQEELEKTKRQRDKYKGMIFKSAVVKEKTLESKDMEDKRGKSLGGQWGHQGAGRSIPKRVDQTKRVFFDCCPTCDSKLKRTDSINTHTVEDIPGLGEIKTEVIKYEAERQWCGNCAKEVVAIPLGVIPSSRLGINLIIQILIWKYVCRMSFEIIAETLNQTYGVEVSVGGVINILKRTKKYLGSEYDHLLSIIRGSPVKHADETSWRIEGLNGWLWAFLTKDTIYYTIEHTRGKGVAEKVLSASKESDVLVRDDYPGYKKLKMNHQSCWRHLLGESREASRQEGCSKEVKQLHRMLKRIYGELEKVTKKPIDKTKRQEEYLKYGSKLREIVDSEFKFEETKKIQTRIKNQGNNLITALLFEGVELTNNLAERGIRKAVVARKISGGSRSEEGAESFAVNMSVVQTLRLRNEPLIQSLRKLLLKGALEKTN